MTLAREEAEDVRARLIAAVREEFRDRAPQITDEQIWAAWVRTGREMSELLASDDPLAKFVPKNAAGRAMISPPMVAMGLVQDAIEGRL